MCGLHEVACRAASAACCVLMDGALLVFMCLLRPLSVHCSVYVLCTVLSFCSFSLGGLACVTSAQQLSLMRVQHPALHLLCLACAWTFDAPSAAALMRQLQQRCKRKAAAVLAITWLQQCLGSQPTHCCRSCEVSMAA